MDVRIRIGDLMVDTFTLTADDVGTATLFKPLYAGEDYELSRNLVSFDFWSEHFALRDDGINKESITLTGIEHQDADFVACFPLCFPICFANDILFQQFLLISQMMKQNKEVTISGLGDDIDGVYIIEKFTYKSMHNIASYSWIMTLEWVREE